MVGVEVYGRSGGVWWEGWRCERGVEVCGRNVVRGVEVCGRGKVCGGRGGGVWEGWSSVRNEGVWWEGWRCVGGVWWEGWRCVVRGVEVSVGGEGWMWVVGG